MAKRTKLYILCLVLFPLAFAGFVVGFGCPVWIASSDNNNGLWQTCQHVFKDCKTLDFDDGRDWMIGVRAVEIFALVMLSITAAELAYESCCTDFSRRKRAERTAPGVVCLLGGLGGLAGIIVYAVKMDEAVRASGAGVLDVDYGWAMMLLAAASGLAVLLGVGFCVSGCFLEKQDEPDKTPLNLHAHHHPYHNHHNPSSHGGDSYEMLAYSNKAMTAADTPGPGEPFPRSSSLDPYPGHALYTNGLARSSSQDPNNTYYHHQFYGRAGSPPKSAQYYSYSGEEVIAPFDLSEGYLPTRPRSIAESPYYSGGSSGLAAREDPYPSPYPNPYPYARSEDPGYARGRDPYMISGSGIPRAGVVPESSRYLGGREDGARGFEEGFYRPARY